MKTITELLQEYFNDSDHYLAPSKLKVVDTWIREDDPFYLVEVNNKCLEKGSDVLRIGINDVLVWFYNKNEALEDRIKRIEEDRGRL